MTPIPKTTCPPPFEITRASHATFTVRDLARSREFYTEVIGLVVSDEDRDTLYLRGVEERVHHSLVLKRTSDAPACIRTGLRVRGEEDLDKAKFFFDKRGIKAEFVEMPYQSRTLHATDVSGTPIELCATMPRLERARPTVRGAARRRRAPLRPLSNHRAEYRRGRGVLCGTGVQDRRLDGGGR